MGPLYIVMPAYNEAANIRSVVRDWYKVLERHNEDGLGKLVVVNDGSRDATGKILRQMKNTFPDLIVLTKRNSGHGPTLLAGYRYAAEHGAGWIFQTDSDGQTNPKEFEKFWKIRERYDAVFGYRKDRMDGVNRMFVERVLCAILHMIFGIRVPDANVPFRLMRAELVASYIMKLPKNYELPNVMLTVFFVKNKNRVRFVRITFSARRNGKTSMDPRKICATGLRAVRDFLHFRKNVFEM